jgi:hypothetical protein
MRFAPVAALVFALALGACATPESWRPDELASVPGLLLEPSTGPHVADDLAMGFDGALVLPAPDGGPSIEVPHRRSDTGAREAGPRVQPPPPLDLGASPRNEPGLGSSLWQRRAAAAPYRSGVELYRSRQLKLLVGTRTLIDEYYPDPVTTDPRHQAHDLSTAAVVGLRLRF